MSAISVKICGITRAEDALMAESLGADAVGFVFYPKSRRYISPSDTGKITAQLGPFIARVGVFVDEEPSAVLETARIAGLTAVQLHGSETQSEIDALRGIPVIKAFRVGEDFDPGLLGAFNSSSAYLLDTAGTGGCYGGTGRTFDWSVIEPCKQYGRIILAGGLNPENAGDAVRTAGPWALDVSSGVEISPGVKNHEKMAAFMRAARSVQAG